MPKRKDAVFIAILAGAAAWVIVSRFVKQKKHPETVAAQGLAAFAEQKYEEALTLLLQVKSPDFNINSKISECYEQLGNLTSALTYVNKCIKNSLSEELVLKRFKIHHSLDMERFAFKDLFIVNLINNGNVQKENASEFLKKLCGELAKAHKIDGFASPINFGDFFETLFFLKNIQDPAVVFLNSAEYQKCLEFVKESDDDLHVLILGCFQLVNGDFVTALKNFEQVSTVESEISKYGEILKMFVRSKKLLRRELEKLKARINTETDPTILLYIAKVFESIDERTLQYEALQKCVSVYPNSAAFSALIVWYIRQNNHTEAMRLIKLSLKDFPDCMNLVCITLEYYLMGKSIEDAISLMERAEKVFVGDPRVFLFKYMISEAVGNPNIDFLRMGIKIDPMYFKLHIYLGNVCSSGEESAVAYREALKCARSHDEIFTAYQLLVVIETQNEIFKDHPSLFPANDTGK